jgi:hypothetical protein
MPYLNEELARAGLVRVDYSKWKDYAFLVGMKGPAAFEVWQERLDRAAAESSPKGREMHPELSPSVSLSPGKMKAK